VSDEKITAGLLRQHDACDDQVATFEREWPDGCVPTLAICHRALALGLDLDWAARKLLPATAAKAYDQATATAWNAYAEAMAPARKAYNEAIAPAAKAYEEARAPAFVMAWKSAVAAPVEP
jgi:hypothetical protein